MKKNTKTTGQMTSRLFNIGSMAVRPVIYAVSALLCFGCMSQGSQFRGESKVTAKLILYGMRQIVEQDVLEDPVAVERAIRLPNGWESLVYYRATGAPVEYRKATGWDGKEQAAISDYVTKFFNDYGNEESGIPISLEINRAETSDTRKRLIARLIVDLQARTMESLNMDGNNCIELHDVLKIWPEVKVKMHSVPAVPPRLPGVDYVKSRVEVDGLWGISLIPANTRSNYSLTVEFLEKKCAQRLMLIADLNSRR